MPSGGITSPKGAVTWEDERPVRKFCTGGLLVPNPTEKTSGTFAHVQAEDGRSQTKRVNVHPSADLQTQIMGPPFGSILSVFQWASVASPFHLDNNRRSPRVKSLLGIFVWEAVGFGPSSPIEAPGFLPLIRKLQ
jgi:hypothetical protein